MKLWLKLLFGSIGILVAAILCFALLIWHYLSTEQSQMFADPVFETVPPEIPASIQGGILVFSKTLGFRHKEAIEATKPVFHRLGDKYDRPVFFTENAAVFNQYHIKQFDVVVFNNASRPSLTDVQQQVLQSFIASSAKGKGFIAIHAAGDNSHDDWPWYVEEIIRAEFTSHTLMPQFQDADVYKDTDHPVVNLLDDKFSHRDEWYGFKQSPRAPDVSILLRLDEQSYYPDFSAMGDDHPIAWAHEIAGGKVVYTALGHSSESVTSENFVQFLDSAIHWIIQ